MSCAMDHELRVIHILQVYVSNDTPDWQPVIQSYLIKHFEKELIYLTLKT